MKKAIASLKYNKKTIAVKDLSSLLALFTPGFLFAIGVILLAKSNNNFFWLKTPLSYPPQFWIIAIAGTSATAGGIGDWVFHRLYVAAGPRERYSHLLALTTGGIPLFVLMAIASTSANPRPFLIPIILVLLYTTVLICYDEFIFHIHRCTWVETLFHRLLVFGNAIAFLAWLHWIYAREGLF